MEYFTNKDLKQNIIVTSLGRGSDDGGNAYLKVLMVPTR